ncbi:ricin-type beta-trefoil lectin domain protein [Geomonas sp. RF6]|uniref:ricin-type beta-trefoil lectin domain protein n=1 Tax=Geomonas sp. RF6 TaxID=2897342 RepID=UPI001E3637A2|nr:ricin-type beta-trefoil lectin domain protein [Geomonas sp. RF6]UFS71251.1 ricin-type beta-trefoil lectin domain protein [Geomonas sp. RF6]
MIERIKITVSFLCTLTTCLVFGISPAIADRAIPEKQVAVQGADKGRPGANVHQLATEVEKLIKEVENSTLTCPTRNSIVRRLRELDDALRSGNPSAAQAMALAWRQHAWSLQSGKVVYPELGSSLQNQLREISEQIGTGWSPKPGPTMKWKPLPICDTSTGDAASASGDVVGGYTPTAATDVQADIEIFLTTAFQYVPVVGNLLAGLTQLLWPQGPDAEINNMQAMVKQAAYDQVSTELTGIGEALAGASADPEAGSWNQTVANWRIYCEAQPQGYDSYNCYNQARETLWGMWNGINVNTFIKSRNSFQQNTAEVSQLDLLPLYAQYENLYVAFLRDGILLHKYWDDNTTMDPKWSNLDNNVAATSMDQELDSANTAYGVGYVDQVFTTGLNQQPSAASDWRTRNEYLRNLTLSVLDARDVWKYQDPRAYPGTVQGGTVPGGVKLTRMIYTYPTGHMQVQPTLPYNVAGPLKEITTWTKQMQDGGTTVYNVLSSMQATTPPLLGPAQSGAITGVTTPPTTTAKYYNLTAAGPISEVKTQSDVSGCIGKQDKVPAWIGFYWAAGGHSDNGTYESFRDTNVLQYDGHVLATGQIVSSYSVGNCGGTIADSVVFGFRYADSFNATSGEVEGVASGKCIRLPSWTKGTQAEIYTCNQPPANDQIWSYDPALEQISVTNPAEFTDTDPNPNNSGKLCLDAAGSSTARYTPVVINSCDDGAITSWSTSGGFIPLVTTSPHTGTYAAQLGKTVPINASSTMTQRVTVPSGASALSFWYQPHCAGSIANEQIQMQIRDTSNNTLANVLNVCSNSGVWTNVTFDTSVYAGQTVALWFNAHDDGAAGTPNYFLLDDIALTGYTPEQNVVQDPDFETGNFTNGVSSQRWTIEAVGADKAKIINKKSGLALEVSGYSATNGAKLILEPYAGGTAQQWKTHSPLTGEIHGIGSGRCVDVPNYSTTPGTQVQIYDCHGNWAQQWTYNPTTKELIYAYAPTLCLEARNGGTTAGTPVQINTCTGALEQQWTLHGDGYAISNDKSGLVLDVPGGATANNTLLQLNTANSSQGQLWSRTSRQGGALHAVGAKKCLDLSTTGIPVINSCATPLSTAQTWTYHPISQTFTVASPSGTMCLDAPGAPENPAVVISECSGAASQHWLRMFSNVGYPTVTNVNSGLLLDLTGTTVGATVQLSKQPTDNNGNLLAPTSNEVWVWSPD